MRIFYLYLITCLINNKKYIGQTYNPKRRWNDHKSAAKRRKSVIASAINKHGKENFTFEFIACAKTQEDTDYLEQQLIIQYNTHILNNEGYNVERGGAARIHRSGPNKGRVFSDEWKANLSKAKIGIARPDFTDETRSKMSQASMGNTKWLGKKHKPETIEKLKNKVITPEHRAKLSEAKKKNDIIYFAKKISLFWY